MTEHCHSNIMRSRQVPVYSGILFLSCVWIQGVDSTPKEITVTRGYTPNATVTAGRDAVLVCNGEPSDIGSWYKVGYSKYIAYIYEGPGNCTFRSNQSLPGLELGSSDCRKHALRISNISKIHEGRWRCTITIGEERAVNVHVVASPAETTTVKTSLSSLTTRVTPESKTTSLSSLTTPTSELTSHFTASAGIPGSTPDATTESTAPDTDTSSAGYKTESRTQDSVNPQTPSVTSMTTILGGTVGGALVLLAAIITVCCLLRSKKEKQNNGSAQEPVNGDHRHQDPEQREDAGMADNVLYDSYGGDVGQAAKHQDPLVLAGRSQPDSVVGDIYAIPDKQRTSTLNAESPGRSQPDSVVVDIYAIPDKQRTSTLNEGAAAGDVYSVVQKQPKSEGETMQLQSTDKDAEMSELYSQVQKPQKNGK
ncbi:uncharacterized protein LOC124261730 [Haliotis rubra]|uniref:uncharacterized protein LOC124261730 n=1 Tax=Haliotis rubra TaxID=36100 RepID=UPI001EE61E15|nr:uncharacterized protein LOC124261730 [Haliotis rubra]